MYYHDKIKNRGIKEMDLAQLIFYIYFALLGTYLCIELTKILIRNERILKEMEKRHKSTSG
jgi:hypothetical protein